MEINWNSSLQWEITPEISITDVSVMEINSSGSAILYLYLELIALRKNVCL